MIKEKLPKRFSKLLKYSVAFSCRLSPPPKTYAELDYILRNLQSLATVELIRSTPLDSKELVRSGFWINILYNPTNTHSMFLPILLKDEVLNNARGENYSDEKQKALQSKLLLKLGKLIAIPRYSFYCDTLAKNDDQPFVFRHSLKAGAEKFEGYYNLTTGTMDKPLISIAECEAPCDKRQLRSSILHNFKLFHKFDKVELFTNRERNLSKVFINGL